MADAGRESAQVSGLFTVLMTGAAVIWTVVIGTAIYAQRHQARAEDEWKARAFILWGGAVFPVVVLGALLTWGLFILRDMAWSEPSLTVAVDGEQWWWRVVYETPDGPVTTANEIHLPLDETTEFRLTSHDVIHSFWIPAVGGKMDLIPGRENRHMLTPTKAGEWGGICAEYCGGAHAQMRFDLIAEDRASFDAWLAREAAPAEVSGSNPGFVVFLDEGCHACHTIRGTEAVGRVGPDLTHFASRKRLGGGILLNTPENLANWITRTDELKPGVLMPAFPHLEDGDLRDLTSFLGGLQ
jgi:cytochrome c oxidase subunit II